MPILRPKFFATPASRIATLRRVCAGSALALMLALPLWQVGAGAPTATHAAGHLQLAVRPHPLCDGAPVPC